jgi:long-chain acyl-CoA synthetase
MQRTTDIINPKTVKTIPGLFLERVRRAPHACAYRRFNEKESRFKEITWEEILNLAARWQVALRREGLHAGDRAAVMLKNCLEWVLFDLAALGLRLVTVPLFAKDRPENVAYILKETGARFILIEEKEQLPSIGESNNLLSGVERIVTLRPLGHPNPYSDTDVCADEESAPAYTKSHRGDPNEAGANRFSGMNVERDQRISDLTAWLPETGGEYVADCRESGELATIVYTSGTTGVPKGVMLSHANILEDAFACLQCESIYPDDLFLSFLPLSHTFERTVGYYIPMMAGACVAHVRSIDKLSEDLRILRPTVLISVPRIYERIHKTIIEGLDARTALARYLFHVAVHTGWRRFLHRQGRLRWSFPLLLWPFLNQVVAKKFKAGFGGRLRLSISGGASLAHPIARIFIGLGLNLLQGYGLTETSPVISVNTTYDNIPTSVGRSIPGVETAVAATGELLIKGPNVMLGYWRNREATNTVIDHDGWFHTGDLAQIDEEGHITIAGRLKEIIVLSTGEKVSPADLELAIAVNPLFEQVMVVGEGRPYLAALIVLNRAQWEKLAASHGMSLEKSELLFSTPVENLLLSEIAHCIARFPAYAQIRRVYATLTPWGMQDGLITATLKLRREELLAKFKQELESLFKGHRLDTLPHTLYA